MITEKKEKQILMMSFFSGLLFAIAEFIFAILSPIISTVCRYQANPVPPNTSHRGIRGRIYVCFFV